MSYAFHFILVNRIWALDPSQNLCISKMLNWAFFTHGFYVHGFHQLQIGNIWKVEDCILERSLKQNLNLLFVG